MFFLVLGDRIGTCDARFTHISYIRGHERYFALVCVVDWNPGMGWLRFASEWAGSVWGGNGPWLTSLPIGHRMEEDPFPGGGGPGQGVEGFLESMITYFAFVFQYAGSYLKEVLDQMKSANVAVIFSEASKRLQR